MRNEHASSPILVPGLSGFDENTAPWRFDPALANALFDRTGHAKRDAQGLRLVPDGKSLTLTLLIFPGNVGREVQTLMKKNMDAIGVRMDFRTMSTQDLFKETRRRHFQIAIRRAANRLHSRYNVFLSTKTASCAYPLSTLPR